MTEFNIIVIVEKEDAKLNVSLNPISRDKDFIAAFNKIQKFVDDIARLELIILYNVAQTH
jgi:hypothetical protein